MPMSKSYGGSKKKPAKPRKSMPAMGNDEAKWRAEDDARILMRAEEVRRDKARLATAQAQAKRQMEELAKVVKK